MTAVPAFTPARDQQFLAAAAVIRDVQQAERRAFEQGDPTSPANPWMPFQAADFLSILFECIPEMGGRAFLDIGCGPGSKMRLASHFYGLDASGIEIDPGMAQQAELHGNVLHADALTAPPGTYAACDLIWLYRPFRAPELEDQLEQRVMAEMHPGAILAGGSWETCPGHFPHRWITVVDDWELRRGAWMKPLALP